MNSEMTNGDGQESIGKYITECRNRGISILPPDINLSDNRFNIVDGKIRYKLTAISHVGESAIEEIIKMRPIKSFDDFIERRNKSKIKSNVVESIIKSGCFDYENENRSELLYKFNMSNRTNKQIKENYEIPKIEWSKKTAIEFEKDSLGMYLTVSPFDGLWDKPFDSYADGSSIVQWVIFDSRKTFLDKNKNEMSFINCTTKYGSVKLIVFASTWKMLKDRIDFDSSKPHLIHGRKSKLDIIVEQIEEVKNED